MYWNFCVLGTKAGGAPLEHRRSAAAALVLPSETLLFDCAEGTQNQLLRAGISRSAISRIFISHLHGDHVIGLPGLLCTFSGDGRTKPLHIYAPDEPQSFERWIRLGLETMEIDISFPLIFHTLSRGASGEIAQTKLYSVTTRMLEHRIPSFGFRVEETPHANIDIAKAESLGLKAGALLGEIKRQGFVELSDGRTIRFEDISAAPRRPQSFVYCGDTRPCDGVIEIARRANVLVHEATFAERERDKARDRFHSTAAEAAAQARAAEVGRLFLTHVSVRYPSAAPLLRQARKIFPRTLLAKECRLERL